VNDYGVGEPNPSGFDDRGRWFENARAQVRAPGLMLQCFGLASFILSVLWIGVLLIKPDMIFQPLYDWMVRVNREQPPEERQRLPQYEEWLDEQVTQNVIGALVSVFASGVIFIGGMKMKDLSGYAWGVAGSVLAILPCNFCCCIGAIFGAWALVVLFNSDVRLAFTRAPVMLE
jgi:hypothetical protein